MQTSKILGISPRGWRSLALWTSAGTAGCVAFSVIFNMIVFRDLDGAAYARGIAVAIALPILLAGPLFFFLTLKLRELARLNHQLRDMATKDHVTGLLNRRALIARIQGGPAGQNGDAGQSNLFLVIDADRFKSINDTYGHASGDVALRLIASALSGSVRAYDSVGRIGGEEFGLFLPNVTAEDATYVADRLRRAVASLEFRPLRERHDLSVSIGGVVCSGTMPFNDLFKIADANLYCAKAQGRNRCIVTQANAPSAEAAAAMRAAAPGGLSFGPAL